MLSARGGIECDLTVTRLSETAFLLVVLGATLQRDLAWLRRHLVDEFVVITDMTAAESVFAVMGPKSRDLLQKYRPTIFQMMPTRLAACVKSKSVWGWRVRIVLRM